MTTRKQKDDSFVVGSEFEDCQSYNYDVVTVDTRVKLIKLVCLENYKINQAARILEVNQSTAKYIIRSFRNKGKILIKTGKQSDLDKSLLQELAEIKRIMKIEKPAKSQKKEKKKRSCKDQIKQKQSKEETLDDNIICWPVKQSEKTQTETVANLENQLQQANNPFLFLPNRLLADKPEPTPT